MDRLPQVELGVDFAIREARAQLGDGLPQYRLWLYNRFVRWSPKASGGNCSKPWLRLMAQPAAALLDSTQVKAHRLFYRTKRGFSAQALGTSRGGRTTKIHALSDGRWRPLAFLLTGGQATDCRAATSCYRGLPIDPSHGRSGI
jgi:hypothetical protein